ncbi:MAG: HD domain-containing protein [Desulfobulbaceae bacterium]|nr:HD domain-containing protein [Desulfobulbaceae bacterium]
MKAGISFLNSKIARRFCLFFILGAFIPTLVLMVLSYYKVATQLEEQGYQRLKRDTKSYSIALYDRLKRVENDLFNVGRVFVFNKLATSKSTIEDFTLIYRQPQLNDFSDHSHQFRAIAVFDGTTQLTPILGKIDLESVSPWLTPERTSPQKPFLFSVRASAHEHKIFIGVNLNPPGKTSLIIVGEIEPTFLWGVGPSPILPPMTELSVYDKKGEKIVASSNATPDKYGNLSGRKNTRNQKVFQYELNGNIYFASIANLFLEAHFQKTGWVVILSQTKSDIMSSMDSFKKSFPFIILFFLLLILYLSLFFIRKGLEPLEKLQEGTKRIGAQDFGALVDIKSKDEFEDLGNSFNMMAGRLDKQFTTLTVLAEIDRAILSLVDRSEIISTTLLSIKKFFQCDITLFAKNSVAAKDHVKVYFMTGQRMKDARIEYFSLGQGEREQLFHDSQHAMLDTPDKWPHFLQMVDKPSVSKYLCLPLSVGGKIHRVLLLGWQNSVELTEEDIGRVRKIADQLAIALSNANLLLDMKTLAMGTIEALARTVDAKSKWTSGHSERVAILSGQIAQVMGLPIDDVESLARGGLLHDIGKIGIPVSILDKPEELTSEEFKEIQNHPEIGAKILEPIEVYQDIVPLVRHHHEKFDGSGYPDGLKGDEIDIRARIMAVADVWDAVVSDRPYREGWIHEKAKNLIIEGSGTHFDPRVVEAFLSVVSDR